MLQNDGQVDHIMFHLAISAQPANIPNEIPIDISALEIGEAIRVGDLALPHRCHHRHRRRGVIVNASQSQEADLGEAPEAAEEGEEGEEGAEAAEGGEAPGATPPRAATPSSTRIHRCPSTGSSSASATPGPSTREPVTTAAPTPSPCWPTRHGGSLRRDGRIKVLADTVRVGQHRLLLAFPQTYYNESGVAAGGLLRRHDLEPDRLVVVHDELDLPTGRIKVKFGGGLAGNKGLASIKAHLGTDEFARVRIGVGKPPGRQQGAGHVLRRPGKAERTELDITIEEAADAVEVVVDRGHRQGDAALQHPHRGRPRWARCRRP